MNTVEELQNTILQLGQVASLPEDYLLIGDLLSDVVINVEIHSNEYHYVVVERGIERKRIVTDSLFDIIYLFIESASHAAAANFEFNNRIPGQDFRRLLFQHQLDLLNKIGPEYARKRQDEIEKILKEAPYNDT